MHAQHLAQWAKRNNYHRSKNLVWCDPEGRWTSTKREERRIEHNVSRDDDPIGMKIETPIPFVIARIDKVNTQGGVR